MRVVYFSPEHAAAKAINPGWYVIDALGRIIRGEFDTKELALDALEELEPEPETPSPGPGM